MFRAAIDASTELGRQVEPILDAGELVPDELTVELIRERLVAARRRGRASSSTASRATSRRPEALDAMLGGIGRGLDAILFFDVSDEIGDGARAQARRASRAAPTTRPR